MRNLYKKILIGLLLSLSIGVSAQSYVATRTVISALGGSYGGASYTGDYTIGEIAVWIKYGTSGNNTFTEGFHQGNGEYVDQKNQKRSAFKLNAYPNPVSDVLNIEAKNLEFDAIILKIYSLSGKLVKTSLMKGSSMELDVSDLKSGTYFIHAVDKASFKRVGTVKIQKL